MFSMAVTALAKSLIVVMASLHPAAASPAPAHYAARPGDTLSGIAAHEYGNAADWPALWWINRHAVPNPDVIAAGQRLALSSWHPRQAWLDRAARAAIAVPAPARPASAPTAAVAAATGPAPAPAPAPAAGPSPAQASTAAPGSFQACVIARESGGNARAVNPASGAGGLYQFLPSTWQSLGYPGLPQDAPVSVQNAAFQQAYAQSGTSPWAPSDGC
ncbi:MAG: transglycosylase family protein [Streptosporangiaceae bacterium]